MATTTKKKKAKKKKPHVMQGSTLGTESSNGQVVHRMRFDRISDVKLAKEAAKALQATAEVFAWGVWDTEKDGKVDFSKERALVIGLKTNWVMVQLDGKDPVKVRQVLNQSFTKRQLPRFEVVVSF
jgi:hypothetical protein